MKQHSEVSRYAIIQVLEVVNGNERLLRQCFIINKNVSSLEGAQIEREKLAHKERYIIIQIW